jgi:hypothetical protein
MNHLAIFPSTVDKESYDAKQSDQRQDCTQSQPAIAISHFDYMVPR